MSIRDLDAKVDLSIDDDGLRTLNENIDDLVRSLRLIDDGNLHELTRATREASRELDEASGSVTELDIRLENLDDVDIDVDLEVAEALADLHRLQMQIESMDQEDIDIGVEIESATIELDLLLARIEHIDGRDIDIDVDIGGALGELALLRAQLELMRLGSQGPPDIPDLPDLGGGGGLGGFGKKLSGGLGGLITPGLILKLGGILALLPAIAATAQIAVGAVGALGVAVGVLSGGLLGLASAVAVGGIGIGSFAAVAVSSIMKIYEKDAVLNQAQKEMKKSIDAVGDSWNKLQGRLEGVTFAALNEGLKSANVLLKYGEPIIKNSTKAVDKLFESLNKSLKGSEMKGFFSYLERAVEPLTLNLGKGLGNAVKGVTNIIVALEPLTKWVGQGFENMMGSFADWSKNLIGSDGMKSFIDYTKDNLPKIGNAIGDMTLGIVDFFAAFSGSASGGFDWFEDLMSDFADWSANLDTNEGFQKFLDDIAKNGPTVAKIIGDISSNVIDLTNALSGSGLLDLMSGGFDFVDKYLKNDKLLEFPDFFSNPFENMGKIFDFDAIGKDLGSWFKNLDITKSISGAFKNLKMPEFKNIDFKAMIPKFKWPEIRSITLKSLVPKFMWPIIKGFNLKSLIPKFLWPVIEKFNWNKFVKNFKWPSMPKFSWANFIKLFKWPTMPSLNWSKYVQKFNWPKLPSFNWSSFVKMFNWPKLPGFSWSTFIKLFKWPSIKSINLSDWIPDFHWPKISMPSISVPKMPSFKMPSMPKFGFASGIGNVPEDMDARIHKGESVIPKEQAQDLRERGIIEGNGRKPQVNIPTAAANNKPSGNTFNLTVNVNGGNTNEDTARIVTNEFSNFFANLSDIFPDVREG